METLVQTDDKTLDRVDNNPTEVDPIGNHDYPEMSVIPDPYTALGGQFFERGTKDTPCKFHDGFSGRCWKGSLCPYSHAMYTGGKFAESK